MFGGKLKSFDEAKVTGMKGVKKVVRVNDHAVAVVADTWWHAKTALDALPIVWDEGDNAKVSSASIAKWLEEGLDSAQPAFVGNQNGDAKAAVASAAKKVEAVYNYPYQNHATMEPLNATALYTADKCEVWCGTQNGEAAFAATLEASGLPADKCEVHKQMLGGGFGRRGQTDYVRQAVAIAKQMPGTPIKLLWSREEDMQHGTYHPITQCKLTGAFDADNNLTALQVRISGQSILFSAAPGGTGQRHGSGCVPGPQRESGDAAIGYTGAEPSGRTFDAQSPRPAGLLARRQRQSQRDLSRMLHGRTGAFGRPGPGRVPAQADDEASEAPRRAQCGRRKDRLGQAGAARRLSRHRPAHGLCQLCCRLRPKSRSPTATRSRCIASSPRPTRAMPSIRRRSSGKSPVRSSMACRAVLRRLYGQGRPHRAGQLRHLQFDADQPRCRRWNRSSCRAAASGAASASRRSASRRPRCSTLTSRRRENESARCRCGIRTSPSPDIQAAAFGPPLADHFTGLLLMDARRLMTRRNVVRGIAASAASLTFPCPSIAQSAARVVVIGGGFGGASCARALRRIDAKLQITLIEPNRTFTACPFSNEVIAGLREIEAQQFSYDKIIAEGVTIIAQAAVKIDPQARDRSVSPTARRSAMTAWCWRPASTSSSTRCPAMTRRPRPKCRMPGRRASRRCCCAGRSKPWRMAALVVLAVPAAPRGVRLRPMNAPA